MDVERRLRLYRLLVTFPPPDVTRERTEEDLSSTGFVDNVPIRYTDHLHDTRELFKLILARKDRDSSIKLGKDTPDDVSCDGACQADSLP